MTPRGSTLLLAMILLAVLSVIGVAAVSLSSQERTNASIKSHRDQLLACAAAAQATLWAELVKYGPNYFSSGVAVPVVQLPDGTTLKAGHYPAKDASGNYVESGLTLVNTSYKPSTCVPPTAQQFVDLTNKDAFFNASGTCSLVTARCIDTQGRELEVEFGMNVLFQK